jgi:hypothetical protein
MRVRFYVLCRVELSIMRSIGLLILAWWVWSGTAQAYAQTESPPNTPVLFLPVVTSNAPESVSTENAPSGEELPIEEEFAPQTTDWDAELADVADAVQAAALMPSVVATGVVTLTEDHQALGYPDSRKIVRDRRGNLYVAFRRKLNGIYRIFVAHKPATSTQWVLTNAGQPIDQFDPPPSGPQRVPSITIDERDGLHVAWYGIKSGQWEHDRQIFYARSLTQGASWEFQPEIAPIPRHNLCPTTTLWQEHPVIYATIGRTLYLVWEGRDGLDPTPGPCRGRIKLLKSTDRGATWQAVAQPASPVYSVPSLPFVDLSLSRPSLVVSQSGKEVSLLAYATFTTPISDSVASKTAQLVWTRSPDGGVTWQPWAFVHPAPGLDQRDGSLVRDCRDRLYAAWRQGDRSRLEPTQIFFAVFRNGAWSAPEQPAPSPYFQFFPSLRIQECAIPWLTWSETPDPSGWPARESPSTGSAYVTRKARQGWTMPIQMGLAGWALYPSFRSGRFGKSSFIDMVWLETDSSGDCTERNRPICQIVFATLVVK